MKPGRELDALIAEKVMGSPKGTAQYINNDPEQGFYFWPRPYSTKIDAAWEVVAWFEKKNCFIRVHNMDRKDLWSCILTHPGEVLSESVADAETAPHAICLAALNAVSCDSPRRDSDRR